MIRKRAVPENHNPHAKRGIAPWKPGRIWEGETVALIGGGPTLKQPEYAAAVQSLRGKCKVIAINQSFEIVPWADMLYFADCSWFQWNKSAVRQQWPKDKLLVTATSDVKDVNDKAAGRPVLRMWRDRNRWSLDPAKVYGWDSGTQAANLAFSLGAKRILLFGIDLTAGPKGETQWHTKHKRKTAIVNYKNRFLPTWLEAVRACKEAGVEVIRVTPGADIGAPLLSIDEVFPSL